MATTIAEKTSTSSRPTPQVDADWANCAATCRASGLKQSVVVRLASVGRIRLLQRDFQPPLYSRADAISAARIG